MVGSTGPIPIFNDAPELQKASGWLQTVFFFGAENGEGQLTKSPSILQTFDDFVVDWLSLPCLKVFILVALLPISSHVYCWAMAGDWFSRQVWIIWHPAQPAFQSFHNPPRPFPSPGSPPIPVHMIDIWKLEL